MNWLLVAALLAQLTIPRHSETMDVVVASVDVTVTDKDGNHVSGLHADDFELLDNGVPQKISNFSEIQESRSLTAASASSPAEKTPEAAPAQPHKIVFIVDNLSLHPDARKRVFDSARRFLRTSLGPNDEAMIVTCANGLKLRLPFTNDRDDIEASLSGIEHDVALGSLRLKEVAELREELLSMENTGLAIGVARQYASRNRGEVQHTADVLKSVLAWLAGVPGKKALVFMTEALPAEPGIEAFRFINTRTNGHAYADAAQAYYAHDIIDSVSEAANAASTTIYPIYARGLSSLGSSLVTRNPNPIFGKYTGGERLLHQGMMPTLADAMMIDDDAFQTTKHSLDSMAISTGGFATTGGENFDRVFSDIAADLGSYYSIGYRPSSAAKHPIVIRMKNRDWTARARQEVINKSDRERSVDLVTGALFERTSRNDLGVTLHFGKKSIDAKKKAHMTLSIRIPIEKLTLLQNVAKFDIHLRVADQTGGLSQTADATREINVPASDLLKIHGKYYTFEVDLIAEQRQLRIAAGVTDVQGGTTSIAMQDVDLR
jgi:VWFA-related protein